MDGPYRSAPGVEEAAGPRDRGLVDDIVDQFVDPLAFYRELVQNAIDAGSPSVEVELRDDVAGGALRARVRDRGCGMDPATIEHQLLVLFRSTKEGDPTKIGRFGIGFASVLAPRPRRVTVDTVRAGRRSLLELRPDLTFSLYDGGPALVSGTTVEVELARDALDASDFVARSRAALLRWCRHTAVPLRFTARDGSGALTADERIDRPLGLDEALVQVQAVSADGAIRAVVGLLPGGAPYQGYFNRGLMLAESTAPLVGPVAFKVQSPGLGHTLSRDDVRRDRAFEDCLALVQWVAAHELPGAMERALAALAATEPARWAELLAAVVAADVALPRSAWVAPLVAPVAGATTLALSAAPSVLWVDDQPGPLTAALADAGVPVIAYADRSPMSPLVAVATRFGCTVERASEQLTLVHESEPTERERAMLAALARLLDDGQDGRPIVLATLAGARAGALSVTGSRTAALAGAEPHRWLLAEEEATAPPLRGRPPLVLATDHPLVAAARARAASEPTVAADALARAMLHEHRGLDAARAERLLTATLGGLLDGPGVAP